MIGAGGSGGPGSDEWNKVHYKSKKRRGPKIKLYADSHGRDMKSKLEGAEVVAVARSHQVSGDSDSSLTDIHMLHWNMMTTL